MTWKFDGDYKYDIVVYLKWLSKPPKSNFLVCGPISKKNSFNCKFIGDYNSNIAVYLKCLSKPLNPISLFIDWFQLFFSSFNWKFIGDSKSNILVFLKCLSKPLKPNFLMFFYGLISKTIFFSTGKLLHEILTLSSLILEWWFFVRLILI